MSTQVGSERAGGTDAREGARRCMDVAGPQHAVRQRLVEAAVGYQMRKRAELTSLWPQLQLRGETLLPSLQFAEWPPP